MFQLVRNQSQFRLVTIGLKAVTGLHRTGPTRSSRVFIKKNLKTLGPVSVRFNPKRAKKNGLDQTFKHYK